jgi:hypothetical protein
MQNNMFILTDAWSGFRKNKSAEKVNKTLIKSMQEALDSIQCDKFWYIIGYSISYGIRSKSDLWFKAYLSHQLNFVEAKEINCRNSFKNNYSSLRMKTEHSVLQGSVSMPLYSCCV